MPTQPRLWRELLEEARDMRSAEQQRAFEEKLASTATNAVSPLQRRTVSEVKDPSVMGGSARPADFIAPYYGDKFGREVAKAMLYNARRPNPFLEPDSYSRLYDTIQFERDRKRPRGDSYSPTESKVELANSRSIEIDKANAETLARWASDTDPKYKEIAEASFRENSFESPEDFAAHSKESAAEHEFTHHATRPNDEGVGGAWLDKAWEVHYAEDPVDESPTDYLEYHTVRSPEITQAAARFQRELFAKTGKRIEKPEDFEKIVYSDDKMDFMTPEARRYLVFARRFAKDSVPEGKVRADKERKAAVRQMAEILPATVSADDSFESRINERISGLMG